VVAAALEFVGVDPAEADPVVVHAVLVRRARNEGYVWEQIAACLDVSKQAVHKKHAGRQLRRRKRVERPVAAPRIVSSRSR
jgi:hypothetical protein